MHIAAMKQKSLYIVFFFIFLIALVGLYATFPLQKQKLVGSSLPSFEDAKLQPYTPPVVFHHNHVMMLGRAVSPAIALPRYLKYKEKLLVPPRTQGKCASCWAFAIADMLADRLSIHTRGRIREHLSPQELLSCLLPRWFPCDQGGIPEIALRYPMIRGLLTEEAYPYENEMSTDIKPCKAGSKLGFLEMMRTPDPERHEKHPERIFVHSRSIRSLCDPPLSQKVIDENIVNMKIELMENGPIIGTVLVYDDLYSYDGESIYEVSKDARLMGGHAITIFGWSDAGSNTEEEGFQGAYWICRNSWLYWPKDLPNKHMGWFYVRLGRNEAGIESRASCADIMLTEKMRDMGKDSEWLSTAYTSYNSFVTDPDRMMFFEHLAERRQKNKNTRV